jgi:PHD/YefM family antitoxin component YafN of YafNO toxin-antitoxin module
MLHLDHIRSLTEFQRHTSQFVTQLKQTGKPLVLTVNGRAELVVQDAQSYQHLLDQIARLRDIEALLVALEQSEQSEQGSAQSARPALKRLRQKLEDLKNPEDDQTQL